MGSIDITFDKRIITSLLHEKHYILNVQLLDINATALFIVFTQSKVNHYVEGILKSLYYYQIVHIVQKVNVTISPNCSPYNNV